MKNLNFLDIVIVISYPLLDVIHVLINLGLGVDFEILNVFGHIHFRKIEHFEFLGSQAPAVRIFSRPPFLACLKCFQPGSA